MQRVLSPLAIVFVLNLVYGRIANVAVVDTLTALPAESRVNTS